MTEELDPLGLQAQDECWKRDITSESYYTHHCRAKSEKDKWH